jgi:hypothetical protein
MHFSAWHMRDDLTRAVRALLGVLIVTAVTALAIGMGTADTVAAQSSDFPAGGLSSGPASNGGGADSSSADPNGLQGVGGATASGAPKAAVAGKEYNFGSVLNGVPVSHVFKIHNAGTGTLIIGAVQTSCGCTAAKPTRNDLAPGEDSDIAVSFDTRFDKGPATRTVTVFTNDPSAKEIVLTLKGDVKVQVEAAPAQVAFGDVKYATAQSRQVFLNDLVGGQDPRAVKNFKVQSLSNANPNIKVAAAPRTDGKAGAVLTVAMLDTMPVGAFDDTIKVTTSRAPVDITVFGTVQGDLTVKPAQVSFGVVPHHQGTLRFVRLVNEGARPVKVTGVTSSNVSVSATIEPVAAGKEYKITLALQPNSPDGALHGQIAITTDDPEQQTLNLPFYGIVGSFRG